MEKQEMDKKLEQLKKAKCSYPNCKKKQFMTVSLPVGKLTETGGVVYPDETKEQSIQMGVPLCDYHFIFASKGHIRIIEQNNQTQLIALVDMIDLIETVIEAKEFIKIKKGK